MNLQTYIDFTKRWEGGLSRDTNDSASSYPCPTPHNGKSGYHTNIGITYKVWHSLFGSQEDRRSLKCQTKIGLKCLSIFIGIA